MTTRPSPTSDRFVVHVGAELEAGPEESLAMVGRVEAVLDGGLTVLRLAGRPPDAREAWRRLCGAVGPRGWAAPVLVDASGQPHYPTGDVTVRFTRELSDAEVEAFAREHGLRLRGRNAQVRAQVTFEPADRHVTYLPELVERLEQAEAVRAAWANTRSAYRRANRA